MELEKNENVVIVAHSGISKAFYGYFNGIPEDGRFLNLGLKNCEIAKFQIFMHYKINNSFLAENQILEDCYKISHIPTHIYQNRWDPCCPPSQAYLLDKPLPKSKLFLRADKGHVSNSLFWQMYLDNVKDYK